MGRSTTVLTRSQVVSDRGLLNERLVQEWKVLESYPEIAKSGKH
jgi:hypothetical protein